VLAEKMKELKEKKAGVIEGVEITKQLEEDL